jgi:hypothetical protein
MYILYVFMYLISILIFNLRHNFVSSLPDVCPMRLKHVAGNKDFNYKILIINHFVVATANLTIYVWDVQQAAHCEDSPVILSELSLFSPPFPS